MAVTTETQNDIDSIIVVGDRVDIVIQSGKVYRALIEDRLPDGPFLAAVPSRKGIPMPVTKNDDIYLVFYRDTGRYIAHMKVSAIERRGETKYMWMKQMTVAQKNQRRQAYRLPVSFSVQIHEYDPDRKEAIVEGDPAEEWKKHKGNTPDGAGEDSARAVALEQADSRDLSVTGIALITKKQYTLGDKYTLILHLEGGSSGRGASGKTEKSPPLEICAIVKRSIPWKVAGKFNTGMHFTGVTKQMAEHLSKFVLTEQQRQIRMRRL